MAFKVWIPLLLVSASSLIFSCAEDPEQRQPTLKITELKALDLGNNGDASDIRIEFQVTDNIDVIEYRIMIIPLDSIYGFNINFAASVPESGFLRVFPQNNKSKYSIKRLPSQLLDIYNDQIQNYYSFEVPVIDIDGSPLRYNLEYVSVIFVLGKSFTQLSEYSRPIRLINQGIYSGDYYISNDTIPRFPRVSIHIMDNQYGYFWIKKIGDLDYQQIFDDTIYFSVNGTAISDYHSQKLRLVCPDIQCNELDTCAIYESGDGSILDELIMHISVSVDGCDFYYEKNEWYERF